MGDRETRCILAGDVGGTKTVLAAFPLAGVPSAPVAREAFASREYPSLAAAAARFLEGRKLRLAGVCVGVAGPVIQGRVQATNLPWILEESALSRDLGGAPVRLLNDLEALGQAVPFLPAQDLHTMNDGQAAPCGVLAVIAPGTGLGEAFLAWDSEKYRTFPSEGGHADFAPGSDVEAELLAFLRRRFPHVSVERVCSGSGLPNIYEFLKQGGRFPEPEWLREMLRREDDPTPVIIRAALEKRSPLCREVVEIFLSILGGEAGNLALKVLATGGVYLGGGLPPRLLALLDGPAFMRGFTAKGRFAALMARIPVRVITNPDAGLLGAARFAFRAFCPGPR